MEHFICTQCGKAHKYQDIKYWHETKSTRMIEGLYCSHTCATADHESQYIHPFPMSDELKYQVTKIFKQGGLIKVK